MVMAVAFAVFVCGCAAKIQPLTLPGEFADCTVARCQPHSVLLACAANDSYTNGPMLGPKIVELDMVTKKVIRSIP